MIKIQEESQGTSTKDDMIKMLTNFHYDDSQAENCLIPAYRYTEHNVLEVVENNFDIRITPMKDIEEFVRENYALPQQEIRVLNSGILKKKKILKRQRAKNRHTYCPEVKIQSNYFPIPTSAAIDLTFDQSQKKKKRNRISAQISRDKKKIYLQQLEQQNNRLHQESQQIKEQNLELKKQLYSYKTNKIQSKSKIEGQTKGKFFKLLLFLGVIFFLSLIKEAFKPKSFKASNYYKSYSSNDQASIINKAETYIDQLEFPGIKTEFSKVISSMKNKPTPILMPANLYETIHQTTQNIYQ